MFTPSKLARIRILRRRRRREREALIRIANTPNKNSSDEAKEMARFANDSLTKR